MTVQLDTGTPPPNRVELTSAAADVAVVTLIGEHDLGQYDTLAAVLARAGVGALNVIVDLTHCAFVDSITISLLLNADPVEAYFWYGVAARSGVEGAQRFRTVLGAQLSAPQRQAADARLSTWKTQNADGETQ